MNCRLSYALPLLILGFTVWAADPPGVRNFQQVDDHLYRGAQPTPLGFGNLQKLGVRMIVDLRGGDGHREAEKAVVEKNGMRYIHIPLNGYHAPSDGEMAQVLAALDDSTGWPVFIHCKRGADRTGTVVACYRIAHDHWPNQKALEEAKLRRMSWTEWSMQKYILGFDPKRCCVLAITQAPAGSPAPLPKTVAPAPQAGH